MIHLYYQIHNLWVPLSPYVLHMFYCTNEILSPYVLLYKSNPARPIWPPLEVWSSKVVSFISQPRWPDPTPKVAGMFSQNITCIPGCSVRVMSSSYSSISGAVGISHATVLAMYLCDLGFSYLLFCLTLTRLHQEQGHLLQWLPLCWIKQDVGVHYASQITIFQLQMFHCLVPP